MAYFQRTRDIISNPFSPDLIRQRSWLANVRLEWAG